MLNSIHLPEAVNLRMSRGANLVSRLVHSQD